MIIARGHKGVALYCHASIGYSIFRNGRCVKQTHLANHAHNYAKALALRECVSLIIVRERSKAWRNRGAH